MSLSQDAAGNGIGLLGKLLLILNVIQKTAGSSQIEQDHQTEGMLLPIHLAAEVICLFRQFLLLPQVPSSTIDAGERCCRLNDNFALLSLDLGSDFHDLFQQTFRLVVFFQADICGAKIELCNQKDPVRLTQRLLQNRHARSSASAAP